MAFGGLDKGENAWPLPDRIMIIVPMGGIMNWMAGLSGIR